VSTPNILIIMADQLTASALKAYGGKTAKTPTLDRLARDGVVFERFYCNSPLCAPSRYVMVSGQQQSAIGAYDNAADFPADTPTFAHHLRAMGYHTLLSGKMHFCGPDQLHGFEERLTTDIYPADYGWTPDWNQFDVRPGWYHTMDSVIDAGSCVRTNQIDFDEEVVTAARQRLFDIARDPKRRPFCMVVSMTHPHDPYVTPQEYWDRYEGVAIDPPAVVERATDPHSERIRHVIGINLQDPNPEQTQRARRAYYGSMSFVDDQIERLMTTLTQTGLEDDTIVMVLADHGDMLGERGLWFKMSFFENACRIPLIVHAPTRFKPRRVAHLASLVDLLPTLVDLAAGAPQPKDPLWAGRSLLNDLQGHPPQSTTRVIGEYCGEAAIAPVVMIRTDAYKFIHSPVDPDQLYHLSTDPLELNNLADHPDARELVTQFRAMVREQWNLDDLHQKVLASQKRRRIVYHALRQGHFTPWDHQPLRLASKAYIRNDQELNDLEAMARFPRLAKSQD